MSKFLLFAGIIMFSMKYEIIRKSIARKVYALRTEMGLNQRELAAKAGLSQKTISNIENILSTSEGFQLEKLNQLADAFGIEVWDLIKPDEF